VTATSSVAGQIASKAAVHGSGSSCRILETDAHRFTRTVRGQVQKFFANSELLIACNCCSSGREHALRSLGNSLEGDDHISATINDRGSS
jgi:hypothetical protein